MAGVARQPRAIARVRGCASRSGGPDDGGGWKRRQVVAYRIYVGEAVRPGLLAGPAQVAQLARRRPWPEREG